jgi:hypothetical protein
MPCFILKIYMNISTTILHNKIATTIIFFNNNCSAMGCNKFFFPFEFSAIENMVSCLHHIMSGWCIIMSLSVLAMNYVLSSLYHCIHYTDQIIQSNLLLEKSFVILPVLSYVSNLIYLIFIFLIKVLNN